MTDREFVRSFVERTVSTTSPWTSYAAVRDEARKTTNDADPSESYGVVDVMVSDDILFEWHGLITLADVDILKAIVQNEVENRSITRSVLIKNANQTISRIRDDSAAETRS